jgi:hypothetical protein
MKKGDGDGTVGSSPHFSAYMIGPLIRVCGELCGHGKRWFLGPRRVPFYMALCERGPTATGMAGAPDQGT